MWRGGYLKRVFVWKKRKCLEKHIYTKETKQQQIMDILETLRVKQLRIMKITVHFYFILRNFDFIKMNFLNTTHL